MDLKVLEAQQWYNQTYKDIQGSNCFFEKKCDNYSFIAP